MPVKNDERRLNDMLNFARKALDLSQGRSRRDLDSDELYALAIARLLELIGEAAAQVSKDRRTQHPEIPWAQIVGMRNRLIHGYDTLDPDITWQVISRDLLVFVQSLERILSVGPSTAGG